MGFGDHVRDLSKMFKPTEHVKITTSKGEFNLKPKVTYQVKNSSEKNEIIDDYFGEEFNKKRLEKMIK